MPAAAPGRPRPTGPVPVEGDGADGPARRRGHAQAQLTITKTHVGDFTRGGQGVYRITVTNSGDQPTSAEGTRMTDSYPAGLQVVGLTQIAFPDGTFLGCNTDTAPNRTDCTTGAMPPGSSYTVEATVDVASDAPCTVTNTASVTDLGDFRAGATASDLTNIPGGSCNSGNGGGSILPVNLSGILPMFNNITTNNNILSPGGANTSNQRFGLNTP
ncbi:putative repeat protein (TIGR01451 family) [Streptomyces sp. 2132.2]|nr:putative repeat protein (TIGR01451 family) [Streptomyces sp. 2132.2]